MRRYRGSWAILWALHLVACGQDLGVEPDLETAGRDFDVVSALQEAGADVVDRGVVSNPPFQAPARRLSVDGRMVWAFEYPDSPTATIEAARFSRDGTKYKGEDSTSFVTWVGPPHLFQRDAWIVAYPGSDQALLDMLVRIMGAQFAGSGL